MDVLRGPFALWQPSVFADAVLECDLRLHGAAELAGVIFRAQPGGDEFAGYDVTLDSRQQHVVLRRHSGNFVQTLANVPAHVRINDFHHLKIAANGNRLRVWLDHAPVPCIDTFDPQPFTQPGYLGLRVWGAAFSARNFSVQTTGQRLRVDSDCPVDTEEARRQALQAFCLIVLNLNEFVYID